MKKTITAKQMLAYLQRGLDEYRKNEEKGHPFAEMQLNWLIGQKEMVETLIEAPVNLQIDGRVTIGIDGELEWQALED